MKAPAETVNKVLIAVFQQNRRPLMYVTVHVASCGFSTPCSKPFLGSLLFLAEIFFRSKLIRFYLGK